MPIMATHLLVERSARSCQSMARGMDPVLPNKDALQLPVKKWFLLVVSLL